MYQQVPLHDEAELQRLSAEKEQPLPSAEVQPHEFMLARLQFELEERARSILLLSSHPQTILTDWTQTGRREEGTPGTKERTDQG